VVEYFPPRGDMEASGDWFSDGVAKVIGNGFSTQFWHDPWCGNSLLRVRFRRFFQLSLQQGGRVGELGAWVGGCLGVGPQVEEEYVCLGVGPT